ncbi:PP2C family protein-serine/threonine phosphatase [Ornithinimicrobium avium]|uniref:PP2C family protein-serine/threonine phosphatase n=1 Tax=Ornithinimicrobium avium TaxID=2283195 RepID=UPI001D18982C|nr:protein phosphatase 2C domain-containing protein [Ornithinimicrobium avium]
MRYAVCSERGPVRSENQDAVALDGWVWQGDRTVRQGVVRLGEYDLWNLCVLDGLGGYEGGAVAALVAASTLSSELRELMIMSMDEAPAFAEAFDRARGAVTSLAAGHPRLARMGTTAASVVVAPGTYAVTNVGDVRVYRYWRGSYLTQLSVDDRAAVGSNVVTQTLGPLTSGQLDVHHCAVGADDATVLLLCSDGLSDALPEERLRDILNGAEPYGLTSTAQRLVAAALEVGAQDNVTVALIAFDDLPVDEEKR